MDKQFVKGAGKKTTQRISRKPAVPAGRMKGGEEALSSRRLVSNFISRGSGDSDIEGINQHNDEKRIDGMGSKLKTKVTEWAKSRLKIKKDGLDRLNKAKTQREIQQAPRRKGSYVPKTVKQRLEKPFESKIFEVASKFNTACVVLGDTNIKNRPARDKHDKGDDYQPSYQLFYGQNQGYKLWENIINEVLEGKLTTVGFEEWNPKNCAEVDAIQRATSAGVDLKHAHMYTVGPSKGGGFVEKEACLNCTASFGSSVKDRNYSGWSSQALEYDDAKFLQTLKHGQGKAENGWWCKSMNRKEKELAKEDDLKKAEASREAIIEPSHK